MRAYIIGNGKSLTVDQLDLLIGKPCYASNRINLIYPYTKWRPAVYVHPEYHQAANAESLMEENLDLGIPCWIGEHYKGKVAERPNLHWIKECHHWLMQYDHPEMPGEWHLPQVCSFGGTANFNMQRAWLDGYDELILLGCDMEYSDYKPSHFTSAYEYGGEIPAHNASRNVLWGHIQALSYIRRKNLPLKVLNATRGGNLNIWERVKLEDYV